MVFLKSFVLLVLAALLGGQGGAAEWRWEGKVAVVTGASSGIGAATVVALADRGVTVVGLARREGKIKDLRTRTNGTIIPMKCDMFKEDEIVEVFRAVEKEFGGVDILVNNAGISITSNMVDGKTSDWTTVLNLNVIALSIATREALKSMRTRGDNGQIININSIVGHQIPRHKGFNAGIYSPSKYAVTALTETISHELSVLNSNIKVSSVSPGLVNTELIQKVADEFKAKNETLALATMNFIEPTDIADGIIYILSTRPNVQIAELTIQPIGSKLCSG